MDPGRLTRRKPPHLRHVERLAQHVPVQNQERAEGLVLGGGGHILPHSDVRQKRLNFGRAHLPGMPLAVEKDKAPNPVDVALFRANAVVLETNPLPDFVQQLRRPLHGDVAPCAMMCSNTSSLAVPVHLGKRVRVIRH